MKFSLDKLCKVSNISSDLVLPFWYVEVGQVEPGSVEDGKVVVGQVEDGQVEVGQVGPGQVGPGQAGSIWELLGTLAFELS